MFNDCSVEYVAEVVVVKKLLVLLVSNAEAFEQVIDVGLAKEGAVLKAGQIRVDLVVVFNGFNNIALSVELQEFFGNESVAVVKRNVEVGQVAIRSIKVNWMAEGTLIVGNGPGGG